MHDEDRHSLDRLGRRSTRMIISVAHAAVQGEQLPAAGRGETCRAQGHHSVHYLLGAWRNRHNNSLRTGTHSDGEAKDRQACEQRHQRQTSARRQERWLIKMPYWSRRRPTRIRRSTRRRKARNTVDAEDRNTPCRTQRRS